MAAEWNPESAADAETDADDVSLHAAGLRGRGLHRHPQRARAFFHPGDGAAVLNVVMIAAACSWRPHGRDAPTSGFRAGHRRPAWRAVAQSAFSMTDLRGEGFRYPLGVRPRRDPTVRESCEK